MAFSLIPQVLIHCIFIIQFKIGSNFPCDFFLTLVLFRNMLFNFQTLAVFLDILWLLIFNLTVMIKEHILYYFSFLNLLPHGMYSSHDLFW